VARPGDLDQSFGSQGRVTTATSLGGSFWPDASVQTALGPDDTILAAVGNSVFRYLADGSLDPRFGEGGKLTITDPEGLPFFLKDIAVDGEGKIIAFGEVRFPGISLPASYDGATIPLSQAAIVRYDRTGSLDQTFGGGDGSVVTDFDQPPYYTGDPLFGPMSVVNGKAVAGIASGAVDKNGSLTLLVSITALEGCFRSAAHAAQRLIVRLTPAGDLNPSFGGDGIVSPWETGFADIASFSGSGNGSEVLAGRALVGDPCGEPAAELVGRLRPDGGVDRSFASNGFWSLPLVGPVNAITVDSVNRTLLVMGSTVVRLNPRGKLDRRFGNHGVAFVRVPSESKLQSAISQPSGHILLTGTQAVSNGNDRTYHSRRSFTVIRLNPAGRPDHRFGQGGWLATRFGKQSNAVASDAFVDEAGRLVVAGAVAREDLKPTGGIALARYLVGR